MSTRSQKLAQKAYERVDARRGSTSGEYTSFAKKFPALVHTCGLAQAVAFARAKGGEQGLYVEDLAAVLCAGGHPDATGADALAARTRGDTVTAYLRLSRDALDAAVWLKRYVEAAEVPNA